MLDHDFAYILDDDLLDRPFLADGVKRLHLLNDLLLRVLVGSLAKNAEQFGSTRCFV